MNQFFNSFISFFFNNGFAFEMLICNILFTRALTRRKHFVWRALAGFAVFLAVCVAWSFFDTRYTFWDIPKYTMLVAFAAFIVLFCFDVKIMTALFCEVGAFATQHLAFRVGQVLNSALIINFNMSHNNWLYVATLPVIYALSYFLFARHLKENDLLRFNNYEIILLSIALMLISIVLGQYEYTRDYSIYLMLASYDIISCLFTLSIQYTMLKRSSMKQEMQILEHMLYLQKQQFKTSKDTIDIINIKCHDLKHQISQLEGRLSESELNELKDAISIYDLSVKTGNDVLDVILAEKSLKCWQNAIKLNCMVDGAILSFMRSSDIYSLFGNAIDNAIDAVQKLEDPDKRVISLSVKRAMGMVAIHIENYYKGALSFENDLPKTTKKDVRYHGFGLKSIKMIAQKYNGFMSFDASNYIFKLNILLPFRQEKSDR